MSDMFTIPGQPRLDAAAFKSALTTNMPPQAVEALDAISGATPFISRQLEHLLSTVLEAPLEELPLFNGTVVPIDESIPEGATTFSYIAMDGAGIADWYRAYSRGTMPYVSLKSAEFTRPTAGFALGYRIDIEDMEAAALAQMPLEPMLASRAMRGMAERHEFVGMYGEEARNLHGFANHPNVATLVPTADSTGDTNWNTKEGTSIVIDIITAKQQVRDQTNRTRAINSLAIPERTWNLWQREMERESGGAIVLNGETILSFVQRHAGLNIFPLGRLQADASFDPLTGEQRLANDRAIFYTSGNSEVLRYILPKRPRFYTPTWADLVLSTPGHTKTGGILWLEPLTALYLDVRPNP